MNTPARPRSHVVGDVGHTAVALLLKRWGWTADFITSDYGEDLDCTIFVDGRRTALHFRCQVKSSLDADKSVRRLKSGEFSVTLRSTTCTAWGLGYFPVLLLVHDDGTGEVHWVDATSQIRARFDALSKHTVALHVPCNSLAQDRELVIRTVSQFFARLLRLSRPVLQCNVYPVLMPGYRALPFSEVLQAVPSLLDDTVKSELKSTDRNTLPAWATALRVLQGPFLHGWEFSSTTDALAQFLSSLKQVLSGFKPEVPIPPGEWISFVVAPTQFQAQGEDQTSVMFWNRELMGWWSYVLIEGIIRADVDHAFATPPGFLDQIARRARSWDGHWSVNPDLDLAIQFFATTPTTPSYRAEQSALRQHALGQFLPWQCLAADVDDLRRLLFAEELMFNVVRGEGIEPPGGVVYGAIAHPMFDPTFGLIPQASDWTEFASGSVRTKVHGSGLDERLPGQEGPPEITDFVMGFFGPRFGNPPEELLASGFDFVPGLPLDHSQRVIIVQRFRRVDAGRLRHLENTWDTAEHDLRQSLSDCHSLNATFSVLPTLRGDVADLSVSWSPELAVTSADSYESHRAGLLHFFDVLLPRLPSPTGADPESLDVLGYDGELYFEGDDWWPFKREKSDHTSA